MNYTPKTKQWFIDRIGKKVYRDDNGCPCHNCKEIRIIGLIIDDEQHADYLSLIDYDYAKEGVYLNYRDNK